MKTIGIIPARMASSRFPGKPLAKICGLSMIEHVYRRARMSRSLSGVYVATCDLEIKRAVEAFGGQAVMTSPKHERGTDRVAEAAKRLSADVVVNIQGDEPLLHPDMIGLAVRPLSQDKTLGCVNLLGDIETDEEFEDRNEIKVVVDKRGCALYMSREPIPTRVRLGKKISRYKQVCVIPFRRKLLFQYTKMAPTPLELAESIDMMRLIENGIRVKMVPSPFKTYSVDTPADLRFVETVMRKDKLLKTYAKR
jgi:3-deoxy-manno-octulosonate cytidylyltransferase (CMP-KDO synthetase)